MAYSVVLAPDRKKAYAVMDDLTVIDLAKKTYVRVGADQRRAPATASTCRPTAGRSTSAGGGSTLTVYDAQTLKPLKVLQMASDGMDLRRIGF